MPRYLKLVKAEDCGTLLALASCYKMVLYFSIIDELLLQRTLPQFQYIAARYLVRYPEVRFYLVKEEPESRLTASRDRDEECRVEFLFWSTIRPIKFNGSARSPSFVEELCNFLETIVENIRQQVRINDDLVRNLDNSGGL